VVVVKVDNGVGESSGTKVHSQLELSFGFNLVFGRGDSTFNESVVDEVLGDSEALIGPHLPLVVVKSLTVDGVFGVVGGGLGGVPVPVGVGEGELGVATVVVDNGVPDGVEVGGTADVGDLVVIATTVTNGELGVDLGGGVEGLMDVSDVVNDKTESEGLGVSGVGVVDHDIVGVDGIVTIGSDNTVDPVGEGEEGLNDVSGLHLVVGVVSNGISLTEVGEINVMPGGLPPEALALDVVGESGALGEGMLVLTLGHGGVVDSKLVKGLQSPGESSGVLVGEESLGLTGDEEMSGTPEGVGGSNKSSSGKSRSDHFKSSKSRHS